MDGEDGVEEEEEIDEIEDTRLRTHRKYASPSSASEYSDQDKGYGVTKHQRCGGRWLASQMLSGYGWRSRRQSG